MARTTKPLTNVQVKQAKAQSKEYSLGDGRGLFLRIKPNGSKLWVFNYQRPHTKQRSNLGLGPYPALSLADARLKREELHSLLAKDIDPKEFLDQHRQHVEEAHNYTFQKVFERWLKVKKSTVSADYLNDIERAFERHILPKMGNVPIHKVSIKRTIQAIKPIEAKGALETVKRLCQKLNEVMVYAQNTGLIESNPLAGIRSAFASPKRSNLPTLKPEQLPDLMKAINQASIKRTTRCLIEWQLHTMVRPHEASAARWEEIDWQKMLWRIPAERMKTRHQHVVPLSEQALALLNYMEPISGKREYIFPSDRDPKRPTNSQTTNMALKRMGFEGKLVAHGLRSIASTALNEMGEDPNVIEAALAHRDRNETRSAYNRSDYLIPRTEMMARWSQSIEDAAQGSTCLAARSPGNEAA